jgi:hypothetical protein
MAGLVFHAMTNILGPIVGHHQLSCKPDGRGVFAAFAFFIMIMELRPSPPLFWLNVLANR